MTRPAQPYSGQFGVDHHHRAVEGDIVQLVAAAPVGKQVKGLAFCRVLALVLAQQLLCVEQGLAQRGAAAGLDVFQALFEPFLRPLRFEQGVDLAVAEAQQGTALALQVGAAVQAADRAEGLA